MSEKCFKIIERMNATRFQFVNEDGLQRGIELVLLALRGEGVLTGFTREAHLGIHGRIDFLADGIGIEAKVKGTPMNVIRQMEGYAKHDSISELILVSTKNSHHNIRNCVFHNEKKCYPVCLIVGRAF